MDMVKTERRLKKELRMIGFDVEKVSDHFNVTGNTVRNWLAGRTNIPPKIAVSLLRMGIPKKALIKPYEFI